MTNVAMTHDSSLFSLGNTWMSEHKSIRVESLKTSHLNLHTFLVSSLQAISPKLTEHNY